MSNRQTESFSLKAAADLRLKQHLFIKPSGNRGCDQAAAGQDAIGVLLNKPNLNEAAEVGIGPFVPVVLAAVLTAGAEVMSDVNGKAVAWVTANRSLGFLIEGGAIGDTVLMLFTQGGRKA
jgi:hypothetical protein